MNTTKKTNAKKQSASTTPQETQYNRSMDKAQYQAALERMFDIMNQYYTPGSELAQELQELNELTCKYERDQEFKDITDAEHDYMVRFEECFLASMER